MRDLLNSIAQPLDSLMLQPILVVCLRHPQLELIELGHSLVLHLTRLVTDEVFELANLALPDACIVGYCLLLHDDHVLSVTKLLL